jgi:hypothetical protein
MHHASFNNNYNGVINRPGRMVLVLIELINVIE